MDNKEKLNRITQIANNEEAAVALFNDNVEKANSAIEDSLSRSGKGSNTMLANLSMGGNAIINTVMRPVNKRLDGDVVVWGEVKDIISYTNLIGQNLNSIKLVGNNITSVIKVADNIERVNYVADNLWALADSVKNFATGSRSLAISADGSTTASGERAVVIGSDIHNAADNNVLIGNRIDYKGVMPDDIAQYAMVQSVAVGDQIQIGRRSVAVGSIAKARFVDTAVGPEASAKGSYSAAIGFGATTSANAQGAIQLGYGTNSVPHTFNVGLIRVEDRDGDGVTEQYEYNYQLLNADGKIPVERIPTLSAYATKEYVDTTEQEIISDYMEVDSELQTQINGQAAVLAEVREDAMSNMAEIADLKTSKQDKLTAGSNITIAGNVISAAGGSGGGASSLEDIAEAGSGITFTKESEASKTVISSDVDLTGYVQNTATGTNSLSLLGYATSNKSSVNIGDSSQVNHENSVVIGCNAIAGKFDSVAIGFTSTVGGGASVAIGSFAGTASSSAYATAIGYGAFVGNTYAIQLGNGTNNDYGTMKVGFHNLGNYTLLNSDGTIPAERLVNAPAPDLSEYQKKLSAGKGIAITEGGENYSTVGTITVDSNKVASGFNTRASYLSAPNVIFDESTVSGHSSFEMVIAFEVSSISSSGSLFTVSTASSATTLATGLRIYGGKLSAFCGSSSSTIQGTTALTANTKVYAKLKYDDGSGYTLQYSTNGTTWSTEATLASTSIAASLNADMFIGYTAATAGGLKVYLPETYVTIDGKEVWRASETASVAADSSWVAAQSMPSSKVTNLTLGATGSTFIAPATGWVYLDKNTTAEKQNVTITNTTLGFNRTIVSPITGPCRVLMPILKGHTFAVYYAGDGTVNAFRFYYAEGEK